MEIGVCSPSVVLLAVDPHETKPKSKRAGNCSTGLFLIPGNEETRGHGTVFFAKFWKQQLQELLQAATPRAFRGLTSKVSETLGSKAAVIGVNGDRPLVPQVQK
jgi:hypothetical protein